MHPDLPDLTDEELVAVVRSGDLEGFAELYSRHRVLAAQVAHRAGIAVDGADDVVAEAYARLLRALSHGRGPSENFPGYLAVSVRRIAWAVQEDARRYRPTEDLGLAETVPAPETEGLLETPVGAALAALPNGWRTLLWRIEVEGHRVSDIAAELGTSPNAVSATVSRARRRLRTEYSRRVIAPPPSCP